MHRLLIPAVFVCFFCVALPAAEKVIFDTDMVEGFDDGVALMLLANSPDVELLGVTTVAGNSWVAEGTAFTVKQLELVDRTDVPVHMGLTRPLRPWRIGGIDEERSMLGIKPDQWVGALAREDPEDWEKFYRERYGAEPSFGPGEKHAVNFIIDAVRAHPGEITLVAVGPLGNVAVAARMAPDIIPLVKKIVYMGGAFFQPGNVTPAAEFNWWFDPEAARITVRAPFREQVVFGLDVCEKIVFTKGHFDAILEELSDTPLREFIDRSFVGDYFREKPKINYYIWDVLTAASVLEPSLVLNMVDRNIDVVDNFGLSYGQSLAYPAGGGPGGTQTATIVTDINKDRFWAMLLDRDFWLPRNRDK